MLSNVAQWLCPTALCHRTSTSHSFYWSQGKCKPPAPLAARPSWVRCFWTGEGVKLQPPGLNTPAILQRWRWRLASQGRSYFSPQLLDSVPLNIRMQQNRYFSGRECGRWNTSQESWLTEDPCETAWFLRPLYFYLTNLTIYQRVLLAEGREGMLVGRGRGKGQFRSSLKAAAPRMKVLQRTVSGRTASDPQ